MRVTLVVDNLALGSLRSEHGLSILVESSSGSVLFDTGQTDAWLENLGSLGAHLSEIKAIALSHGHYDHAGGLGAAMRCLPSAEYYAHPAVFVAKYARSENGLRYIGIPADAASAGDAACFHFNRRPVEILPGIMLSGEIPMRGGLHRLTSKFLVAGDEGVELDTFEDEQCLILRGDSGTSVLLGCAHRGVENNLLTAMCVANTDELELVLGGLHLGGATEERMSEVAEFFDKVRIKTIACCHCTGKAAYEYLRDRLGSRVVLARAGMSWQI